MTAGTDHVTLDFPLHCTEVLDDRVVIHLDRSHLPKLAAFLKALELGLIDLHVTPAGQG